MSTYLRSLLDALTSPQVAAVPWTRVLGRSTRRCLCVQHQIRSQRQQHSFRRPLTTTTTDRATVESNKATGSFSFGSSHGESRTPTPQTLTEKIVQRHAVGLPEGRIVRSGDYVQIRPTRLLTHDNTWPVAKKFMSMNATKIKDPTQPVLVLDHDVQNRSETNLRKYELIEAFAKQHGLTFFRAGLGIGHQVSK